MPDTPHSQEAEQALLGAVLINPNAYLTVAAFLQAEDFFFLRNSYIWQAMARLHERKDSIDVVTLANELEGMGNLEDIGGRAYLMQLIATTPTSVHAEVYGRVIERASVRRRLMQASDEIRMLAMDEVLNIDRVIDEAELRLFNVTDRNQRRDFVNMQDVVNEYFDRVEHLMQTPDMSMGLPSGFRDLDTLLGGFQRSDLIIFAGRPGMGKTSWLLSTAVNAARIGSHVGIFTMEMGADQLVQRIISMETGISSHALRMGNLTQRQFTKFVEAAGKVSKFPIFIDDTPALNPIQMRTKCRRLKHEIGLDLIIVDYMQLMNAGGQYQNNRVQEISFISRNLKEIARELDAPVLSAAQLSRAVEQRQDKRPVLSDLRESGCVTGDTLVYLPDTGDYVPIRDLIGKTGFRVMSINSDTYKLESGIVTNSFCTGIQPVYKLTTCLGRSIRATANHKFFTVCGWKRLDQLTDADHIALPRALDGPAEQTMTDTELALLGHLIGAGCTLSRHAIQYTTVEPELAQTVAALATEVFGDGISPRIVKETGHNWYQVFLSESERLTQNIHNPITDWLTELGIFGLRADEKRIPDKVFQQPKAAIALFLRHLWATTDGSLGTKTITNGCDPNIYYATQSYELAAAVQSLLLRVGINVAVRRNPPNGKGHDQYHVSVCGNEAIQQYIAMVGIFGNKNNQDLEAIRAFKTSSHAGYTPHAVRKSFIIPAIERNALNIRKIRRTGKFLAHRPHLLMAKNSSREKAAQIASTLEDQKLYDQANSDIYWDQIKSIELDGEEEVFDLTVESNHSYVSNNIIISNSIEQDADIVMFLYRDAVYNEATEFPNQADVIVAKHRNGPTGTVSLFFESAQTRFTDGAVRSVDLGDM